MATPHRPSRATWIWLLPLLLLALLTWLLDHRAPAPQARQTPPPHPTPSDPAGLGPTLNIRPMEARVQADPPSAAAFSATLREATRKFVTAEPPSAAAASSPASSPADRIKSVPAGPAQRLSDAQGRRLNQLRWRMPGKQLDWRVSDHQPTLTFLSGRLLEPAATDAEAGRSLSATTAGRFLRKNGELLALREPDRELTLRSEEKDQLSYTQLRYDQSWQGLKVWPCALTVQLDPAGNVTLMTGSYVPTPADLGTSPTLTVDRATEISRAHSLDARLASVEASELLVYAPIEKSPRLAWHIDLRSSLIQQWDVMVDAHTGEILNVGTHVVTLAATGTGTDLNGVSRTLNLWRHTDNKYYMIDTSKAMFNAGASQPPNLAQSVGVIAVLDLQNQVEPNVNNAVHNTATAPAGPWRADAVSAATNLGKVYDFYKARFNRNSVNGQGGSMTGVVNMNQANAYSDFQTLTMTFGNTDKYAEALDVVAHEMTHSVISTTSKLVYQNQSGALNESFADIFGEGCEAHFNSGNNDWKMGTAMSVQGRAFNPPSSKQYASGKPFPDKFSQFVVTSQDNGGVHVNSSITNHAFYLLAQGLSGAIGIDQALQIFYRAVTTKLNPQSQFVDSRLACVTSATELYGAGSNQALKTAAAFDAVEIFDQQATPDPVPTNAVNAPDSTLFIFPSGGFTYLGRRENLFSDPSGGVFLGDNGVGTPVMPAKKPAVSGDGGTGLFVAPNADAAFINTQTGAKTYFGYTGQIESAGLSADGTVQAYVLRTSQGFPGKDIYVYDSKTNQTKTYTAVQPLTDQNGAGYSNSIISVDALDLTPDGRYIYYDALNRLTYPGGGFVDSYSIYFIDRKNDSIQSLIPPIPGVNVGNPSVGQTRTNLITFDVTDQNGVDYIYVADLDSGQIKGLATLAAGFASNPGWPGYSGDDTAVVYTNYSFNGSFWVPYLESQPVQADGLTANGQPFAWLAGSFPTLGLIYRRGTYDSLPTLTVSAPDATATEAAGNPGAFRVTRAGSTTKALPFSFVLSGAAANGTDFTRLALSGQIAAGSASVDVAVAPVDDSTFEGNEDAVFSLSEALHYRIGATASATVTIQDNDTLSFASWAAGFGIGATDFTGDADGDGRRNLVEYALGSNPKGVNTVPDPQVTVTGGKLVLSVFRTQTPPDITYTAEVRSSLSTGAWQSGGALTTILDNTPTLLRVRDEAAFPANRTHFMRLKITKP